MDTTPPAEDAEVVAATEGGPIARKGSSEAFKKSIILAIAGRVGAPNAAGVAAGAIDITSQLVSLHNVPGGTDQDLLEDNAAATELKTGAPYTRKPVTWGDPTVVTSPLDPAFTVGKVVGAAIKFDIKADTVSHYGVWSAGGVFLYGKPLSALITLSAPGSITITPSHSYGLLA